MRTGSSPSRGPPIAGGAVAIGDDGRIAALGTVSDLGSGEHFDDAVILPGFVNAHSHIEYAAYAGFGDGLPFPPWIGLHVGRKSRLETGEMEAIARLGAAECLRSGITTVGDCSFSGAAATACAAAGLRAIVYLEVFGVDASALGRFEELRDRVADAFSDRVRAGVSPHAPYTCTVELYKACAGLGLPSQPTYRKARRSSSISSPAPGRGSRLPSTWFLRSDGRRYPRSLPPAFSAPARSRLIASRSTAPRSRCWQSSASGSRTAPGRTLCSAAAWRR